MAMHQLDFASQLMISKRMIKKIENTIYVLTRMELHRV